MAQALTSRVHAHAQPRIKCLGGDAKRDPAVWGLGACKPDSTSLPVDKLSQPVAWCPPPSQLVLEPPWVSLHGHLSPWTLRQGTAASVTQTTVPHALPPTEDGLREGVQEMSSAWTKVSAGSLVS